MMNNIILIGMSGAGKSTLGVLLAKALNYDFVDTDIMIQQKHDDLLCDIIEKEGINQFKAYEEAVLCGMSIENSVIATGGSVIYSEKGMKHLRTLGKVVYIDVPFQQIEKRLGNIHSRGIVIEEGQTLKGLYDERLSLYKQYADLVVNVQRHNIEETIDLMIEQLD